jgi:hypothetical protein
MNTEREKKRKYKVELEKNSKPKHNKGADETLPYSWKPDVQIFLFVH